jgi:DNA-binding transcriptional LysR family regulator
MLSLERNEQTAIPFIAYPVGSFFGNTIAASSDNDDHQHFNLERVCEAESEVVIREMVRSGHGLTWLPHSVVEEDLEAGDIIDLSNRLPSYDFDVVIYSNTLAPVSLHIFEMLCDIKDRQFPS